MSFSRVFQTLLPHFGHGIPVGKPLPPPIVGVIWHSDLNVDRVYELSIVDFSVIRSAASPYTYPYGIGGDVNVIWHCDDYAEVVYELSTVDFSVIRSAASPDIVPGGIGGE